jgi:beta-glucosidase
MNQILKSEWLFDGFITSDFGAVHSTIPSVTAGLDLEMPTGIYFSDALATAVRSGQLPVDPIDNMLVRRFATMIRFGIFDNPPGNTDLPVVEDGAVARTIAAAGMVLLKNDGNLLPLDPARVHSVALIGPYASKAKTGGAGSSLVVPAYTVDPPAGLQSRVKVTVDPGTNLTQAAASAQAADVAIVMAGDDEAEGADHSLSLGGNQDQLIRSVMAANPKTVVVLKSGSALLMPWVNAAPAILQAWYPGEEEGNALADVLFGDVNPSGKLPQTFPAALADLPANTPEQYPGVNGEASYSEGVFVGYRYLDAHIIQPLFPFGHGLSYTTFAYANLTASTQAIEFDLTNTGSRAGAEVAQVYAGLPNAPVPEPPHQLAAFAKVFLQPGETRHIRLPFRERAFSYWNVNTHAWAVAPPPYAIALGSSSRDIRATTRIASFLAPVVQADAPRTTSSDSATSPQPTATSGRVYRATAPER